MDSDILHIFLCPHNQHNHSQSGQVCEYTDQAVNFEGFSLALKDQPGKRNYLLVKIEGTLKLKIGSTISRHSPFKECDIINSENRGFTYCRS